REDKFGSIDKVPIFRYIFDDPRQRVMLRHLPIRRYFKIDRGNWKQEPDKVFELANLPNDDPASASSETVSEILKKGDAILSDRKYDKYRARLQEHFKRMANLVRPDAPGDIKAYHLAGVIDAMLKDRGNPPAVPDLTELWDITNDANVQAVKNDLK